MSFSFNFSIDSGVNDANCIDTDINVSDEGHNVVQHQHFISDLTIPAIVVPAPLSNAADVHEFSIIPILNSSISIITNASVSSEPENSDLVECVYGGGKKVWECSVDLAIFLNENRHDLQLNSSSRVLELGCGHGIPGMVLLQLGYKVTFTDLNADVLERVTWPNIFKNCPSNSNHAACIAGDWRNVSSELERDRFDLIVSAETLYSPLSCQLVSYHPKYGQGTYCYSYYILSDSIGSGLFGSSFE
ncbi:class I SAM-dependent methyltransferase [archaeon]|nr:MAG: class I SAM-dependent methyltransferase [archaeon]